MGQPYGTQPEGGLVDRPLPRRRYAPASDTRSGTRSRVYIGQARTKFQEGRCVLCRTVAPLRLSHILPAWGRRFVDGEMYATAGQGRYEYVTHDEDKEYLLCARCEQYLGDAENYLSRLCKGDASSLRRMRVNVTDGSLVHGVRRTLIFRALLGILLKAHYSETTMYARHRFADKLAQRLRQRLLADDYPPNYEVNAIRWMDYGGTCPPRDHMRVEIVQGERGAGGEVALAGMLFIVAISGHLLTRDDDSVVPAQFRGLSADRPWCVAVGDIRYNMYIAQEVGVAVELLADVPDNRPLTDETPCPCGLAENKRFADCCKYVWYYHEALPTLGQKPDTHSCSMYPSGQCPPLLAPRQW